MSSDPNVNPISPVSISRTSTFPHKTSPAVSSQTRLIDTNTPAINDAPVELDGSSVGANIGRVEAGVLSPGDEEDVDAEFLGGGGAGSGMRGIREERAAMLASRSKDPGVIVDVPREPTAEEVEAAKSADGTVTPGVGRQ